MVSEIFKPERWRAIDRFDFKDITYHRAIGQGTVRIAFNRPEVRNAFRPGTVDELAAALEDAITLTDVGSDWSSTQITHVISARHGIPAPHRFPRCAGSVV